jgi:hypothetical protein
VVSVVSSSRRFGGSDSNFWAAAPQAPSSPLPAAAALWLVADCCHAPVPLCRQQVDKKTVLENLDLVLLAVDEIVDRGCAAGSFF